MAAPYSRDMRQKLITAYEQGQGTMRELAQLFQVSKTTVSDWIQRFRHEGKIEPKTRAPSVQKEQIRQESAQFFKQQLSSHPSLTLAELSAALSRERQIERSPAWVQDVLKRAGIRYKKKRLKIPTVRLLNGSPKF